MCHLVGYKPLPTPSPKNKMLGHASVFSSKLFQQGAQGFLHTPAAHPLSESHATDALAQLAHIRSTSCTTHNIMYKMRTRVAQTHQAKASICHYMNTANRLSVHHSM